MNVKITGRTSKIDNTKVVEISMPLKYFKNVIYLSNVIYHYLIM